MSEADVIRLELPADTKYLALIDACITATCARAAGDWETLAQEVELAVHEACTNIMLHAYAGQQHGRITMQLALSGEHMTIELFDQGTSFDPDLVAEPHLGEAQVNGFGLFLMRQLMDEVSYQAGPDCNHLRMSKRLYLGG